MKSILRQLLRMAGLVLAAGLASAVLVRYSPGALVDQRELNQRLGEDSLAAMRAQKARNSNVGANFLAYLRNLTHGDLGYSESNNAPIAGLIADRAPATFRELGVGLSGGWLIGLGLAIPVGRFRRAWMYDAASSASAGLLLSLPAALVAYLCLMAGTASGTVLVIVLAPRIFRFARNLLVQAYGAHHVEMARARGIGEWRILSAHILPEAAPQLLALFASSASMAIGAAIPVEAICDAPGLGRLAWQAATARDLPLLVNLTMLVTLATIAAVMLSECMTRNEAGRSA
jgi:peptide/nickel transport system permease protein